MWLFWSARPNPLPAAGAAGCPVQCGRVTADQNNPTAAGMVDLPEATITITTAANAYIQFVFTISAANSGVAGAADRFVMQLDGVDIARSGREASKAILDQAEETTIADIVGPLAAGAHTIKARWQAGAGLNSVAQCRAATRPAQENAVLMAWEVR